MRSWSVRFRKMKSDHLDLRTALTVWSGMMLLSEEACGNSLWVAKNMFKMMKKQHCFDVEEVVCTSTGRYVYDECFHFYVTFKNPPEPATALRALEESCSAFYPEDSMVYDALSYDFSDRLLFSCKLDQASAMLARIRENVPKMKQAVRQGYELRTIKVTSS